jgi:hypothetical protein
MSWSMSWSGAGRRPSGGDRDGPADPHRYPRDRFFIVGFYTRARELRVPELPELI